MPYIDNLEQFDYEVHDKTAMEDFGKILEMNGWTRVKHFYKVVIGRKQYYYTKQETESQQGTGQMGYRPYLYASAKHVLYVNPSGRILGMAEILTESHKLLERDWIESTTIGTDPGSELTESFRERFKKSFDTNKVKGLVYFYTAEKIPSVENDFVTLTYPIESLTGENYYSTALDIELNGMTMVPIGSQSYSIDAIKRDLTRSANDDLIRPFAEPWVMQSPLVPIEMFNTVEENDSVENVYSALNKWDDSLVMVKGRVDSDSITVVFQSDNSAKWDDNRNPIVPLHFGEVEMESGQKGVYALFGGVTPPTPNYDYNTLTKYAGNSKTKLVIPVLKAYPSYPGDGVNSVVLTRTRGGSRYQSVYLSWGASPDSMPPVREGKNGKHYPKSLDFNVRNFGFNPSRYSNSVHTSNVYVVHPEDGVIGKIKNIVGLQTFATNNPELRIRRETCPVKVTDSYHVFTVGSICPFTKTPATTYSQAGIAIRGNTVEKANYSTVPVPKNVKATVQDGVVKVTWEIDETDYYHSCVSIDIDGITVADNVSGVRECIIDLSLHSELSDKDVETLGIVSINDKGNSSSIVEVTL